MFQTMCILADSSPGHTGEPEKEELALAVNGQRHGVNQHKEEEEKRVRLLLALLVDDLKYYKNLDQKKIKWGAIAQQSIPSILGGIGAYFFGCKIMWKTFAFQVFLGFWDGLGVTMAVHRHFAHCSFKASLPVRVMCMLMNSGAFMESILLWAHYHRVHHKWADTDRDITNSERGFFYAHIGWKLYEEHPEVSAGRSLVCINDLMSDPVVTFQHNYYYWLCIPLTFILPAVIPLMCWDEPMEYSLFVNFFRLFAVHNITYCVNSVAHKMGYRPHDVTSHTYNNSLVQVLTIGEGHHNFHHAYPYDYRASEFNGVLGSFTTQIIDILAFFGLVWGRRTVSVEHMMARRRRTGDLSNAVPVGALFGNRDWDKERRNIFSFFG